ncbi:uncharacterized protein LOC135167711 isoform X2 [Diachasmimorpha longicaudata]|uniref:uncharacterized protein LOC135167711 isoform X2 n=1 Tax=Diachasmimorpha longicaudata TaxID=58733 RepID=UPI0030B893BD
MKLIQHPEGGMTEGTSMGDQFAFDDDLDISIDSNPENLSKEDKARKLIRETLTTCTIDDLEKRLLNVACPLLKENIIEIIDQIEAKLGEDRGKSPRLFDDLFIKCQSALEPWNELLSHVEKLGKSCDPSRLASLIDTFPSVVIKISGHCKSKRHQYPKEHLPQLLSDAFRKSCVNVRLFCNLLTSMSVSPQNDVEVLKKIISSIGEIARLSTYDLVTMGQCWRVFMKLVVVHKDIFIKGNSMDSVRSHFNHLMIIINSLYNNIIKSSGELFEKRAKCTVFLLTILDRLHSVFVNYPPGEDFLREMIPNLIILSANHLMCTGAKLKDDEKGIYKARARIITSNFAESILRHYTSIDTFWKMFLAEFEEVKKKEDLKYSIGYHSILLSTSDTWKPASLFFQIVIENINNLQEEILIGSLEVQALNGEPQSVYRSTLAVLVDFLIRNIEDFEVYEMIVMRNLMKESLWPSLMAHDVLQKLYRSSSEDLLEIHIREFVGAYEVLKDRDDSLVGVILGRMIVDTYELLSSEGKERVLRSWKGSGSLRLILESGSSDESIRAKQVALYRKITAVESVNSLPEVIADLRRQPTVKNWSRMVEILKLMAILREQIDRSMTEKLCEISAFIMNAVEESSGWRRRMLLHVMLLLFDCARINAEDQTFNWSLISVLFSRVSHSSDLPQDFLIKLCHYLSANAHRLNCASEDNVPVLSNLFCNLLEHKSAFVRQEALEAYDHVVETCGNDDLVRKITRIIAQRPRLREIVPAYLKKEPLEEIPSIIDYLKTLSRKTMKFAGIHPHQCRDEEEEAEHDDKRFKANHDDLEAKAEDVCENLMILVGERRDLDPRLLEKLNNACRTFLKE